MGLETGTYVNDLVVTNPTSVDLVKFGDDHLRLIKTCLKNTFPNADGAINPSVAEFNHLVGVTSGLQAQLDAKLDSAGSAGNGLTETSGVLDVVGIDGITANADNIALTPNDLSTRNMGNLNTLADSILVSDNGVPVRVLLVDLGFQIASLTSSTVVTNVHLNKYLRCTHATGMDITLNATLGNVKGNWIVIEQAGAGQVTINGTAIVNSPNGLKTFGQYSTVVLTYVVETNTWTLSGDMAP